MFWNITIRMPDVSRLMSTFGLVRFAGSRSDFEPPNARSNLVITIGT